MRAVTLQLAILWWCKKYQQSTHKQQTIILYLFAVMWISLTWIEHFKDILTTAVYCDVMCRTAVCLQERGVDEGYVNSNEMTFSTNLK